LMMDQGRAVGMALQEVNARYGRQTLQIVHAEAQRTINQAMDREAMFARIDLGEVGGVVLHEVEVGWRGDSRIVLQRSVAGNVINTHSQASARRDSSRQLEVIVSVFRLDFGLGCLASRPVSAGASACGHTSECTSTSQEPPAARSLGIHERLP